MNSRAYENSRRISLLPAKLDEREETVVRTHPLGLLSFLHRVVQVVEHRLQRVLEAAAPVNGPTPRRRRAGRVHPVHSVRTNQRVQALGCLFDSLVKGFARAVTSLTENLVLSQEHAVDSSHETPSFAVQVRIHLLLEGRLVEIAAANGNAECHGFLLGPTGDVPIYRNRRVDTAAFFEKRSNGAAGAFGSHQDDVDVVGHIDLGLVLEHGGETVREV